MKQYINLASRRLDTPAALIEMFLATISNNLVCGTTEAIVYV